MIKSELIDILRDETGISKKKAQDVVDILFEQISDVLARGHKVELRDFCSFSVRDYKASAGRNPKPRRKARMKTSKRKQVAKKRKVQVKVKTKTARKTAAKKQVPTATDQVLKIIKRFKKGVGVPALVQRTGLEDKSIRNIIYRAHKQGKIRRIEEGLYVGA